MSKPSPNLAPPAPRSHICLGVTGHRAEHPLFDVAAAALAETFAEIFDVIDQSATSVPQLSPGANTLVTTRLHTLLADGTDQLAAHIALARGYELVTPLPFGSALNAAINANVHDPADARAVLAGAPASDPLLNVRIEAIHALERRARVLELADEDAAIARLYLDKLDAPADFSKAQRFAAESSRRAMLAGRIIVEQADIVIAVWDGVSTSLSGGTGHTVRVALEHGACVVWIDPSIPRSWCLLRTPESLANLRVSKTDNAPVELAKTVSDIMRVDGGNLPGARRSLPGIHSLDARSWKNRSRWLWHGYRRVEALFGGSRGLARLRRLTQVYERTEEVAEGSGKPVLDALRALPGGDRDLPRTIDLLVLRRFVWADGISSFLSDAYRGGMTVSFMLSALAITGGIAYLPLTPVEQKWKFALIELLLLVGILLITFLGQVGRWHGRWYETRRVAEYLRHAPLLLALGVARAPGRWARGADTSWPEWYVQQALREVGLPQARITAAYLHHALTKLVGTHVAMQRDYHRAKAARLTTVHHALDKLSVRLFQLAVASVTVFLFLKFAATLGYIEPATLNSLAKTFTLLGVVFPTFGAAVSGIRFFGDFERFAAISRVTSEKLDIVYVRIEMLTTAPTEAINYERASELVHLTDDIVVTEIENWQAVFGGKRISVPV